MSVPNLARRGARLERLAHAGIVLDDIGWPAFVLDRFAFFDCLVAKTGKVW
jgi:hypothetical protein